MSEFHAHLEDYDRPHQEPQTTSGLAIGSLVCSLIICCPLVTVLGPILGAIALATIGSPPKQKGKGLAMAGIIIGTITTIMSAWVAYAGTVRVIYMFNGSELAMSAGFAGDISGFKGHFHDGHQVPDADAQAFLEQLEDRYGAYIGMSLNANEEPVEGDQPGTLLTFSIIRFADREVEAEAEVHFLPMQIEYILIRDPEQGDLRFPPPQ